MKVVAPSDQNPSRLPFLSQSLSSVSSCCWFFSFWDTLVFCHVILQEVALALGRIDIRGEAGTVELWSWVARLAFVGIDSFPLWNHPLQS